MLSPLLSPTNIFQVLSHSSLIIFSLLYWQNDKLLCNRKCELVVIKDYAYIVEMCNYENLDIFFISDLNY
uniref:Putative ovule protein n=1 Tax=Solanum chacoense TaxID=4108 RepID=A0A0V0HDZ4_SOLCH